MSARRMIYVMMITLMGAVSFGYSAQVLAAAPEKKLMVAVGQEPTSMDPSLCYTTADFVVADNWTDYLIDKRPNGDLRPGLATSWTVSPDGKVLEFILRKGVKFHSGDPLTTKDVEFSFERGRTKNPTVKTRLRSAERCEIIDDYRFKIHLKEPDVTFIPNRGFAVVSKSYYDRVGEDEFVKRPIGSSGPYKFVRHVSGEYVDIERFEGYWGEKPSVKEARFLFVPEDTTRLAKLQAGEVDIINGCPYPSVREVEKSPSLKIIKFPADHPTCQVVFSTRNPRTPWHDKRVRLAMAYAIDCGAIIKNVLYGIPHRWAFLAPYELGYDPNLKPYPYDPQKAKELLAQAGYPNGFDLKLYWQITGWYPMSREVTEAIASYFEAVGIRTKLIGEEYTAALARFRASKGPDAEFVVYRGHGRAGGSDPSYFLDLFLSGDGGYSLYYNPELEKVIAEAKATVNDAKRAEVIKRAGRIIEEEVPAIVIFNMVPVYAMKKNIDFNPTKKHPHDLILVKDITIK
jgi:peptide/nickel transport system substrate-binding protein